MSKKEVLHRFKCLECSNKFPKTEQQWNASQEELKDGTKHPDDLKLKIICPKCNSYKIQHVGADVDIKKKIKSNYFDSIASFFGSFLGDIVAFFILLWEENKFSLVKKLFSFFFFVVFAIILQKYLHIDPIYSCGAALIYKYLEK